MGASRQPDTAATAASMPESRPVMTTRPEKQKQLVFKLRSPATVSTEPQRAVDEPRSTEKITAAATTEIALLCSEPQLKHGSRPQSHRPTPNALRFVHVTKTSVRGSTAGSAASFLSNSLVHGGRKWRGPAGHSITLPWCEKQSSSCFDNCGRHILLGQWDTGINIKC